MLSRLSLFLLTTAFVVTATLLSSAVLFQQLPHSTFLYDEADYAYAASRGLNAHYLDTPTISLTDFLSLGLANRKAKMNRETQAQTGQSLSESIRASDDIAFYRHFHPPLYFYVLILARSLSGNHERTLRYVSVLAVSAAAALTAVFTVLMLLQVGARIGQAIIGGTVALSFSASSPILIETGMTVTPHSLFGTVVAAALGCSGMFLESGKRVWWRALAVMLGLAFLTLEYAPILLTSIILAVLFSRRNSPQNARTHYGKAIEKLVLIIVGVVFLLWPGGFIKLTIVKNYLFFSYFTLVRPESAYSLLPFTEIWGQRIMDSPQLLLALAALLFLIWQVYRKGVGLFIVPCLFYVLLLLLVNVSNHAPSPTYVSSLIPALGISMGIAAGILLHQRGVFSRAFVTGMIVLMPISTALLAWPPTIDDWLPVSQDQDRVLASLQEKRNMLPPGDCLSVPALWLPSIHYYVPELTLSPYDPIDAVANPFGRCPYVLLATPATGDARYAPTQVVTELVSGDVVRYVIVRALQTSE